MAKLIINDGVVGSREVKTTGAGAQWILFSVATRRWNGKENITDWIQCKIFGKRAESKLANMIRKGSKVAILGTMEINEHNGKTYVNCLVEDITVHKIGDSPEGEGDNKQSEPSGNKTGFENYPDHVATEVDQTVNDDDIPF